MWSTTEPDRKTLHEGSRKNQKLWGYNSKKWAKRKYAPSHSQNRINGCLGLRDTVKCQDYRSHFDKNNVLQSLWCGIHEPYRTKNAKHKMRLLCRPKRKEGEKGDQPGFISPHLSGTTTLTYDQQLKMIAKTSTSCYLQTGGLNKTKHDDAARNMISATNHAVGQWTRNAQRGSESPKRKARAVKSFGTWMHPV